jgi:hypothetical protein
MKVSIDNPNIGLDIINVSGYYADTPLTITSEAGNNKELTMFEYLLFFPHPPSEEPRTRPQPGTRGAGARRVVRQPETRPVERAADRR